jgi:lipopolysaccharide transport system ATP-binding protein
MDAAVITVAGLGKRYRIGDQRDPNDLLSESLSRLARMPFDRLRGGRRQTEEWIWALHDVSFEVNQGQVLGVVGRNGAGKTTLLKILSRITEPTTGEAVLHGRVGSLLEVGTGFHPELTGRENVYMSGAVLGMRRAEIDRLFDEIVDFAGVDQFIDTPVKRYSSGMQVRLGFAVAAHLETEILIVDEVLAVGDAAFQRKCLAKMGNVSQAGRTVLFVSHNMPAVESLCTSAVLLDRGTIVSVGSPGEVVGQYLQAASELGSGPVRERHDRQGDGRLRITEIESSMRTGSPSELRLRFVAESGLRNVVLSVGLFTSRGEGALYLSSDLTGLEIDALPRAGTIVCAVDRSGLLPGRYSMNIYCTVNGLLADWVVDAATIEVAEGDYYGTGRLPPPGYGSVAVEQRWSIEARAG